MHSAFSCATPLACNNRPDLFENNSMSFLLFAKLFFFLTSILPSYWLCYTNNSSSPTLPCSIYVIPSFVSLGSLYTCISFTYLIFTHSFLVTKSCQGLHFTSTISSPLGSKLAKPSIYIFISLPLPSPSIVLLPFIPCPNHTCIFHYYSYYTLLFYVFSFYFNAYYRSRI